MEIFKAKKMGAGGSYENYSVSYIFGSDGKSYDFMLNEDAVLLCESYGSPRWELVTTAFPDSKSKSASRTLFNNACQLAKNNAVKQAFTGHQNIDFYDCASVSAAIRNYGYFMFNFRVPNNFYSVPGSGVVPQPSGGYAGVNHSIALIGLTTINGKAHWIAQNGWGVSWGKNGLCYIPYDWGCGVQSPQGPDNKDEPCGWTCESYSVWNTSITAANPMAPANLSASQTGSETPATAPWRNKTTGASTLLYARRRGETAWWPKPSFGSLFSGTSGRLSFDKDAMTYELMAIAVKNNLLSQQSNIITISISLIDKWSWAASNGSASTAQTKAAYSAIKNEGAGEDFSYLVWNDLVDKINEVVIAIGSSWSSYYTTLADAKQSRAGQILTAKQYNAARQNVGAHYSTGIGEVNGDSEFTWSCIYDLAQKLNEWIDSI